MARSPKSALGEAAAPEVAGNSDLRVTVELGLTLPVTQFGSVKPRITISGLDPSRGDVDDQIRIGLVTAVRAFAAINGDMDTIVSQILAPETAVPGMRDRVEAVETYRETARRNFKGIQSRLNRDTELVKALAADVEQLKLKAGLTDGEG